MAGISLEVLEVYFDMDLQEFVAAAIDLSENHNCYRFKSFKPIQIQNSFKDE